MIAFSVKAQKENAAFSGNIEKSAQFQYSKSEFDSLFVYFYREPPAMAFCNQYGIDVAMIFTIDTSGNMSRIAFDRFNFKSTEYVTLNTDNKYGVALSQAIRDSIRKVMYLTTSMWQSRTKDGKKTESKIIVSTRVGKNNTSYFEDVTDTSAYDKRIKPDGFSWVQLKIKQADPVFMFNNGTIRLNDKKYSLAKLYFEQAIKSGTDNINAQYKLGLCYLGMGNKQSACKSWSNCSTMKDKDALEIIKNNCIK